MAPDDGSAGQYERRVIGRLIDRYQEVAQLSREMLAAAHREDWQEVARLEACCSGRIEQLKRAAQIEPLDAAEERRRVQLLREMLQADAQIRVRAEPWLQELERLIGATNRPAPPD